MYTLKVANKSYILFYSRYWLYIKVAVAISNIYYNEQGFIFNFQEAIHISIEK